MVAGLTTAGDGDGDGEAVGDDGSNNGHVSFNDGEQGVYDATHSHALVPLTSQLLLGSAKPEIDDNDDGEQKSMFVFVRMRVVNVVEIDGSSPSSDVFAARNTLRSVVFNRSDGIDPTSPTFESRFKDESLHWFHEVGIEPDSVLF